MQQEANFFDVLKALLQFAILPLGGFMWAHYGKTQKHEKEIAVMQTEHALVKENHDREFKEVKEGFKMVLNKLEEIQKEIRR